jgi:predicted porin
MPFEDFVLQASAIVVRAGGMAKMRLREDLLPGARARGAETAVAASVGFDYRRGPWRVFGEYQRGWNWNFTEGYDTDAWQLGAAYDFAPGWRAGAAVEGLHIRDAGRGVRTAYARGILNLRRSFGNGIFLLAEYGYERRRRSGDFVDRATGHFVGLRLGFSF